MLNAAIGNLLSFDFTASPPQQREDIVLFFVDAQVGGPLPVYTLSMCCAIGVEDISNFGLSREPLDILLQQCELEREQGRELIIYSVICQLFSMSRLYGMFVGSSST